jgi:hypothetical protein
MRRADVSVISHASRAIDDLDRSAGGVESVRGGTENNAETRADTHADRDTRPATRNDSCGHPEPGTDGQPDTDKRVSSAFPGLARHG